MNTHSEWLVIPLEIPQSAQIGSLGLGLRLHRCSFKAREVVYLETPLGAPWLPIYAEVVPAGQDVYADRRRESLLVSLVKEMGGAARRRLLHPFLCEDLDAVFDWSDRKAKTEDETYPWYGVFDRDDEKELRDRLERKLAECDAHYVDPFQAALALSKELSRVSSLDPDQSLYRIVERRWARLPGFSRDQIEAVHLEEARDRSVDIRQRSSVWKNLPDYPLGLQLSSVPSGMPR